MCFRSKIEFIVKYVCKSGKGNTRKHSLYNCRLFFNVDDKIQYNTSDKFS